jgi:Leucine-rich repeat (LRR) protein
VPFRKKAPARPLSERLKREIDEVRAGRASSITLKGRLTKVPDEIRELEGLRSLVVDSGEIETLPSWLADLPHLEVIDISSHPMAALPDLPNVQWSVDAETIIRCDDTLNPAKICAICITPDTSSQAARRTFDLARSSMLSVSGLSIGNYVWNSESRQSIEARWPALDRIKSNIEKFLESQRDLFFLHIWGCPLGRVPEAIRTLQHLTDLALVHLWPETYPDWLFEVPALTKLSFRYSGLTDLPESIGRARNLKFLDLYGNPLTQIPASFLAAGVT